MSWNVLFITTPVVGIKLINLQAFKLVEQLFTSGIIAFTNLKSQNLTRIRTVGIPYPAFARLALAHPGPKLIDNHMSVLASRRWLGLAFEPQTQDQNDGYGAHLEHIGDVSNATGPHSHLGDLPLDARISPFIAIGELELPTALVAVKILLPIGLVAILFYF